MVDSRTFLALCECFVFQSRESFFLVCVCLVHWGDKAPVSAYFLSICLHWLDASARPKSPHTDSLISSVQSSVMVRPVECIQTMVCS